MNTTLDVGRCFGQGWQVFAKNPGMVLLGVLVPLVITAITVFIPFLGWLLLPFINPPLYLGLLYFLIKLSRGQGAEFNDVFAGFRTYGRVLGVWYLAALFYFVIMLPTVIISLIVGISTFGSETPQFPAWLSLLSLVNFAVAIYLYIRWYFAFYLVVDDQSLGVVECFKKSAEMTQGQRMNLFWLGLIQFIIVMIGFMIFFVGALLAVPIAALAGVQAYFQLKGETAPEAPVEPETPTV